MSVKDRTLNFINTVFTLSNPSFGRLGYYRFTLSGIFGPPLLILYESGVGYAGVF